jgi:LysR family transcriptional regulator, low CO2-responsive transcriptional regulator
MAVDRLTLLTLHQLRVFATVAREGSFVRAAEALLISVPSVSGQIKSLEDIVGARLLERSPGKRGGRLTDAGTILLHAYEQLETSLEDSLRQIQSIQAGPEQGTIAFGASLSFGGYAFPRMYEAFHRAHAGIAVNLEIGIRAEILGGVRRGRLDFGVILGPVDAPDLILEPLGQEVEVVLVGPPGHRLAGETTVPFGELSNEQFVAPGDISPIARAVTQLAAARDTVINIAWRVGNIEAQTQAIASGLGIGATIVDAAQQRLEAGQLSLLNVEGFPLRLQQVLMRRPGQLTPCATVFRRFLLDHSPRWA